MAEIKAARAEAKSCGELAALQAYATAASKVWHEAAIMEVFGDDGAACTSHANLV